MNEKEWMQFKLWNHCRLFIEEQKISCAETIWQSDTVIENAHEFIEGICNIIGYSTVPAEE